MNQMSLAQAQCLSDHADVSLDALVAGPDYGYVLESPNRRSDIV